METRWTIQLLGGLRAQGGGRVLTRFRTQKTGVLLAYLAYYGLRVHPRQALVEVLWPECEPRAGRNNLSKELSWLRDQLEPPGVTPGAVLAADRASVQLDPDAVTTDVAAFHAALQAAACSDRDNERTSFLTQAVELYRGPLLSGYYGSWILVEQERLAELYFQALSELIALLEAGGEIPRALQYARQGVSTDPLREETHQDLMRLLAAAGQPAAALRQYRELERLLQQELGASPEAATRALARDLECLSLQRSLPEPPQSPPLEVAHVLSIGLVERSRLALDQQNELLGKLEHLVRGTSEYGRAEACGELLRVPTSDGMALVFFRDPAAPVRCALEIAGRLAPLPESATAEPPVAALRLQMGVHSGPVSIIADRNAHRSVSGAGIRVAQRIMQCGDAGHILLSRAAGELLGQLGDWSAALHDLGECEITRGVRLHLFNLYRGALGNPARPGRLLLSPPVSALPEGGLQAAERGERLALLRECHPQLEATRGLVPLTSAFYVVRPTDAEFRAAIAQHDSLVLVQGARQMGKTSLLTRGLQAASEAGARVVLTDFQRLNAAHLASAETLFLALAEWIAVQLDLDHLPDERWRPDRDPGMNFTRFLRREVLGRTAAPIVWGLDGADRLFPCDFASEVFGLFRTWHNARSFDPAGPWSQLTLAITYAAEAHLFITDPSQSPFNVGTRLTLDDFTFEQVADLNRRYGFPLPDDARVARFFRWVGGHPYLVRLGLHEMATLGISVADLEAQADQETGIFAEHLRHLLAALAQDPQLTDVMRGVLRGRPCPTAESFYRLRSAGVIVGETARDGRPRCQLYATYLERHLL